MLEVDGLHAGYGAATILRDVALTARAGEITCVLGRNGAGKTTLLKAIMGLVRPSAGEVRLAGETISALPPHRIPGRGLGYVPQGRRLFGALSVAENLAVALMHQPQPEALRREMLALFPPLAPRLAQRADTLSGGEQQMLATARALCLRPRVLLLDEPTEGLQPSMTAQIRAVSLRMKGEGVAVILVEQRIDAVRDLADSALVLENGRPAATLSREDLHARPEVLEQCLGV
ncbi:MAG: ABC transporter ATP-binding protein [Pseudomonadota bacterium]